MLQAEHNLTDCVVEDFDFHLGAINMTIKAGTQLAELLCHARLLSNGISELITDMADIDEFQNTGATSAHLRVILCASTLCNALTGAAEDALSGTGKRSKSEPTDGAEENRARRRKAVI